VDTARFHDDDAWPLPGAAGHGAKPPAQWLPHGARYSGSPLLQLRTDHLEVVGVNVAISTVDGAPMTVSVPAAAIVRELGIPAA
jgi:hypothetical protein